jgi:hypothetical protein
MVHDASNNIKGVGRDGGPTNGSQRLSEVVPGVLTHDSVGGGQDDMVLDGAIQKGFHSQKPRSLGGDWE